MHVEDKMSLEQFEQLKETFYRSNADNYHGYLTKDQFKVAISGLLGVHDQDQMLSLLFVKVMLLDWLLSSYPDVIIALAYNNNCYGNSHLCTHLE